MRVQGMLRAWQRWRRLVWVLVGLLALYALVGFWLLPRWLRSEWIGQVREQTGLESGVGTIHVNPFTLVLEAEKLSVGEAKLPLLSVERLRVDLELSSLWHRALVFREIAIDGPFARAVLEADGGLNLARLRKPDQQPAAPASMGEQELPALWIKHFALRSGALSFADRRSAGIGEKRLAPLAFDLFDFRTNADGGGFRIQALSESGEGFVWTGRLALAPLSSRGKFRVEALQARTVADLLGDALPLALTGGRLDLQGSYRFNAGTPGKLALRLPLIELSGIGLRARDLTESPENTWIELPRVRVQDTRLDLIDRRLQIASVRLEQAQAKLWREPDGSLNLAQLWTTATPAADAQSAPAEESSGQAPVASSDAMASASPEPAADPAGWTFSLGELKLAQAALRFEDRAWQPALQLALDPIDVEVAGISQDLGRDLRVNLNTRINAKTRFRLEGELAPVPLSGRLRIDLDDAELSLLQPYLDAVADLDLHAGLLSAGGELSLRATPYTPALDFVGEAEITGFASRDRSAKGDLLSFQSLKLQRLQYTRGPDALRIGRVQLDQAYARVAIDESGALNLAAVLTPARAPTPNLAVNAAPAAPLPIGIDRVVLRDSRMQFADFSIEPNFQAEIRGLGGSLRGLSSDASSVAQVDLAGYVIHPHSPVSIQGSANFFAFDRTTDLALRFHNIDLPVFNPYSGRFAGYSIAKGKLDTDLHYQINNRQLQASHDIRLDQLEWGAATDSKEKVSLPVRMATSLLKDKDGLIQLELPINGTLDDPAFRVAPLVFKVLKNLLVKAVTAPFRLLGGLFKGAEDAQFVRFAPGSASLGETERESLSALAKALLDRPSLRVEVPLVLAPELDREALIEARWQAELAEASADADQDAATPFAELDGAKQRETLDKLYRKAFGAKPEIPETPQTEADLDKAERRARADREAIDYLAQALRSRIVVDPEQLQSLAQLRSDAVQSALLAIEGFDPKRIFATGESAPSVTEGKVQMELKLQ